jgi:hypothetical protein
VAIQGKDSAAQGSANGQTQPLSAISALTPAPGQFEKKLPAVIHDERGNTVYEEPCVAWLHLRIVQAGYSPASPLNCLCLARMFLDACTPDRP